MKKILSTIGMLTLIGIGVFPTTTTSLVHLVNKKNVNNYESISYVLQLADGDTYKKTMESIIVDFLDRGIISNVPGDDFNREDEIMKTLIPSKNDKKVIKIKVISSDNPNLYIDLVLNAKNLYVEGFLQSDGTYYYFSDAEIKHISESNKDISLGYAGNYNNLVGNKKLFISPQNIEDSIYVLTKMTEATKHEEKVKLSFVRFIALTSESFKFFSIRNMLFNLFEYWNEIEWQSEFRTTLENWNMYSSKYWTGFPDLAKQNLTILKEKNNS